MPDGIASINVHIKSAKLDKDAEGKVLLGGWLETSCKGWGSLRVTLV